MEWVGGRGIKGKGQGKGGRDGLEKEALSHTKIYDHYTTANAACMDGRRTAALCQTLVGRSYFFIFYMRNAACYTVFNM